jgi:hypothetical protein
VVETDAQAVGIIAQRVIHESCTAKTLSAECQALGIAFTVTHVSGTDQFTVRYRFRGKQRRLLLGEYPL